MEPGAEKSEVDLGKIVARFNAWQRVMRLTEWNSETRFTVFLSVQATLDLQQENRSQSLHVKKLQKQLLLLEETRSSFSEGSNVKNVIRI